MNRAAGPLPTSQLTAAPVAGMVHPTMLMARCSGLRQLGKSDHSLRNHEDPLQALLRLSRLIDAINDRFGMIATWLILLTTLISAGNAASRYLISASSNAWLEVQWYLFTGIVLFGAPYTLKTNEHVRVDLFYNWVSPRTRLWIDVFGIILFLMPMSLILIYFTWPWFLEAFETGETSSNAGGLLRWPVKLILPVGFFLMALQGLSELIKRVAALANIAHIEFHYEKPLQ
jgi:TRAP-type mannitol/chloroaromatic compound transport system permease small subunit